MKACATRETAEGSWIVNYDTVKWLLLWEAGAEFAPRHTHRVSCGVPPCDTPQSAVEHIVSLVGGSCAKLFAQFHVF